MIAPRLRGHHLVCLRFFRGEGYDDAFVANLFDVMGRLARDERCLVVAGADDVCSACTWLGADGRCAEPHGGEAEIRRIDALAQELLGVSVGDTVRDSALVEAVRDPRVAARWRAEACAGCEWESVCDPRWRELSEAAAEGA